MNAIRRVQRPTATLPVLHLERAVPKRARWRLEIDGAVARPGSVSIAEIRAMPLVERIWDLHCVWGWSRPGCRWRGVPLETVLRHTDVLPHAGYAVVSAVDSAYASCLSAAELRASLIALELDGKPLARDHGGPMRLVPPPSKWAYKGVKWLARITFVERFTPGAWETLVGNPRGDVPAEMLDLKEE